MNLRPSFFISVFSLTLLTFNNKGGPHQGYASRNAKTDEEADEVADEAPLKSFDHEEADEYRDNEHSYSVYPCYASSIPLFIFISISFSIAFVLFIRVVEFWCSN